MNQLKAKYFIWIEETDVPFPAYKLHQLARDTQARARHDVCNIRRLINELVAQLAPTKSEPYSPADPWMSPPGHVARRNQQ